MKEKEVTIYDLASKLNLSTATISRALNDDAAISKKTRKKIADHANEMGYTSNNFASNLRQQKTNTFGLIVPRLNSNFMSTAIAGIEKIANNAGYNLIISQSLELAVKEKVNAKTMYNSRVDGLLVSLAYDTTDIEHFAPFFAKNIPLIFFDRVPEDKKCTCITINNRKAAYDITQHLISQGCKKIAHLTADSTSNVYRDRLRGYKEALADNGILFNEEYVILNDLSNQGGAEAVRHILQKNLRPDGIFAANDNSAVGCMQELVKAGISIPGDIAVAGFNNDPVSLVIQPNLTTVNYPGTNLGETAAHHLISHFKGSSIIQYTNQIILHTELLVRASSNRQTDAI